MQSASRQLRRWRDAFRNDFEHDSGSAFKEIIERFQLRTDPRDMLEATIDVVTACAAYAKLDNQPIEDVLALQQYAPEKEGEARYQVVFDICSKGAARLTTGPKLRPLDLADLYGAPWERFRVVGYSSFWVFRIDGCPLESEEIDAIEQAVTADLRFDYGEDEVGFYSDPDSYEAALHFVVYDNPDLDDNHDAASAPTV
jgi:hypothetical protein